MAKRPPKLEPQSSIVRHVRVFVSSPGDVAEERQLARSVVERLGKEAAYRDRLKVDPILFDDPEALAPMLANLTPQECVNRGLTRPSDCDIVVTIFWGRMGTPLEKPLRKDKTRYLSGTEWEFEDARRGERDILLYRRLSKVVVDVDDDAFEEKRAQRKLVAQFFERLKGPNGGWSGGHATYEQPDAFGRLLESNLRHLLTRLLDVPVQSPRRNSKRPPPTLARGRAKAARPETPAARRAARKEAYDNVTGSFSKPRPNSKVGRTIECSGVVKGLQPGSNLWLAVEIGDLVWPKEAKVLPRDNKWSAPIFEDGATKQFSVSLLVADATADARLRKWLEAGLKAGGKYSELRGIPGTRRLARVDGLRLKK
jgi:Domain of unknown function (DUF4062)